MSTVILAEKPDQARAYMKGLGIQFTGKATKGEGETFLDDKTVVVAAAGHLIELSEPEHYDKAYKDRNNIDILPLVPERFSYQLKGDKKQLFNQIKNAVNKADRIIVATDKDNEGGAIAYNILRLCGALKYKKIVRAYPTALDKAAVMRQFKHLEPIKNTWLQAKAAIARSKSDWLIGMNVSRLYTYKLKGIGINGNYAVGRSISTTLNLICQWYKEIENFKSQPIYELKGKTKIGAEEILLKSPIRVVGSNDRNAKIEYIDRVKKAGINNSHVKGIVKAVDSQRKYKMPPVLMTKGDLYKEMSRVAGWTQSRSKKIMQLNYQQGYQTYPRTDSGKITKYMYDYLAKNFKEYLNAIGIKNPGNPFIFPEEKLKHYLTTEESAGAHLAIIPTEKIMTADSDVSEDQRLMYEVVVRKSLTLLVIPYTYVSNRLGVLVNGKLPLMTQNTVMINSGWKGLLLPGKKKSNTVEKKGIDFRNILKINDVIDVVLTNVADKTCPPKPLKSIQIYDKGGLMENAYKYVENEEYAKVLKQVKGLGTSATRDHAMASLESKKYVSVNNRDIITVTPNGWLINWLLSNSQISDPILTAKWEEAYMRIASGEISSQELINTTAQLVYDEFDSANKNWNAQNLREIYNEKAENFNKEQSIGMCPKCGKPVIFVKDQKNAGKYDAYRCSNKTCDFVIYYNFRGKSISATNMSRILDGKATNKIKQLVTRNGTYYDAKFKLAYDKNHDRYYLEIFKEHKD